MRRFGALVFSLALLLGLARPARAQSAVQMADVGVTYTFGENIIFSARIQSQTPVQDAYLFFQAEGDQNTRTVQLTVAADGTADFTYSIQSGLVRPFTRVYFWYHVTLGTGETYDSPRYFFQYDDNRFPWQLVEDGSVRVHWYAGDAAFGQAAFDAAHAGLLTIQRMFPLPVGNPINIYIYSSASDVQDTLNLGGTPWVGGHASPDLGVVLVSIAPGDTQSIEMERQIPHELAHVLLYRILGSVYANLPTWLLEGIASQAEQYPNADYTQMLAVATQKKTLIPLADLCGPFPMDASGAILAYAESDSFTRYLVTTYGNSSVQALIQAYADGLACTEGTSRALGVPLPQLDAQWQQGSLGQSASGMAFQKLLPYFAILAILLLLPAWRLGVNLQKKGHDGDGQPQ